MKNENIRKKNALRKLEHIIKEKRKINGTCTKMEDTGTLYREIQWELRGCKRKPELPKKKTY